MALADLPTVEHGVPRYAGLRMTADEYLALEDDGFRYEVVDGVVVMSPSPSRGHQRILSELHRQFSRFLEQSPVGEVLTDIDVRFSHALVYRPDLIFVAAGRLPDSAERITIAPDLVVEIISPTSGAFDRKTKRSDYERFGVREYWIVDSNTKQVRLLRLEGGRYQEAIASGGMHASAAVAGFVLDVGAVVRVMK